MQKLLSVDYVEGSELGNLQCHTREENFSLGMDEFFQLLLFVGDGNLKRSAVLVFWLFAGKRHLV